MKLNRRYYPAKATSNALARASGEVELDSTSSYPATLSTDALQADGMAVIPKGWDLRSFTQRGGPLLVEHGRIGAPSAGFVDELEVRGDRIVRCPQGRVGK